MLVWRQSHTLTQIPPPSAIEPAPHLILTSSKQYALNLVATGPGLFGKYSKKIFFNKLLFDTFIWKHHRHYVLVDNMAFVVLDSLKVTWPPQDRFVGSARARLIDTFSRYRSSEHKSSGSDLKL